MASAHAGFLQVISHCMHGHARTGLEKEPLEKGSLDPEAKNLPNPSGEEVGKLLELWQLEPNWVFFCFMGLFWASGNL